MKNNEIDKRKLEQNQNITKQYAVSYAILTYNEKLSNDNTNVVDFACHMIELMRKIKPRYAVKEANKILQKKEKNK